MARQDLEHLARVPLFSSCSKRELAQLTSRTTEVSVPAGRVLVREDSPGYEFFVILSGRALVTRGGRFVAELGIGDFFGELALLDRGPRDATVTAVTEIQAVVLTRDEFLDALAVAPPMTLNLLSGMSRRFRSRHESDARA
jgi:CRP/FNR family transcriptional regulator, cyclic AMP receptor protein